MQRGPREMPVAATTARREKAVPARETAPRQRLGYKRGRALAELLEGSSS
ncbi:MAG TPA: hypothetical protein VF915_12300 [Reyranella sp.]